MKAIEKLTKKAQRIAIVGGGPSTLYLLHALSQIPKRTLSLTIFENQGVFGCGLPFSPSYSFPRLLSNMISSEIPELPIGFEKWLSLRQPQTRYSHINVIPRSVVGKYLSDNFNHLVRRLQASGTAVELVPRCNVLDCCGDYGDYTLETSRGRYEHFSQLIINTGAKDAEKTRAKPFLTPYPLAKIPKQNIRQYTIVGASLTAIDTALGIAHAKGRFVDTHNGISYLSDSPFMITMESRAGLFPVTWYSMANKVKYLRFMENLPTLSPLTLEAAHQRYFLPALAEFAPHAFNQVKYMALQATLNFLACRKQGTSALTKLKIETVWSHALIAGSTSEEWPAILEAFCELLEEKSTRFSASQLKKYHQYIRPLVAACTSAIPFQTSGKLLALINSGALSVIANERHENDDTRQSEDAEVIDCRGSSSPTQRQLPFASLKVTKGQGNLNSNHAAGDVLQTSEHYELLRNNGRTGIYIGSSYLLPTIFSLPGLDNCAHIAQRIAQGMTATH